MNNSNIEEKRNQLNLNIRGILAVIDLIDGNQKEYENYEINSLDENQFLDQQIKLVNEIKERLIGIFKE